MSTNRPDMPARRDHRELTGQNKFGQNMLSGWVVEFVVVISGFVTPRLIDEGLGQLDLGIWDLGWSFVAYFRFLGLGFSSGLNRYVAVHTAKDDPLALDRYVSTAVALQILVAVVTFFCAAMVIYWLPSIVENLNPEKIEVARWVIVFLGGTIGVRMLAWPARGVLAGLHLWSVSAAVNIVGDIVALVAMIIVLTLGGSLAQLGASYFVVTLATEIGRYVVAERYYQRPMFRPSKVGLDQARSLFIFGLKMNIGDLPNLLVSQILNVLIASTAGPATLAVYARSLALQRHAQIFVRSYTTLLTSTAGSLKGLKLESEYKVFFTDSLRASLALTIPLFTVLAFFGNYLIMLWMGERYIEPNLLAALCIGMAIPASHSAIFRILIGLNEHGRPALMVLILSMVVFAACIVVMSGQPWSPIRAAITLGTSLTLGSAIPLLIFACRRFGVSLFEYSTSVLLRPVAANMPAILFLLLMMRSKTQYGILELIGILSFSVSLWILCYWCLIIDQDRKEKALSFLLRLRGRSGSVE